MCHQTKGQFHLFAKDFHIALDSFLQSLEIAKSVYGETDIQVAVLMSDCSTCLECLERYNEAVELLENAINLASNAEVINNETMATLYMNLGAIKNNQGKIIKL